MVNLSRFTERGIELSIMEIVKEYYVSFRYGMNIRIRVLKWIDESYDSDKGYDAIPNILIKTPGYKSMNFHGLEPRYLTMEHAVSQAIARALHGFDIESSEDPVVEPNDYWIRSFESHVV